MYNITSLKGEISAFIHGTTTNSVVNIDGLIYRAARQLLLDVDPQEMKRSVPLASAIYDRVYDYPIPSDVKGIKVIDIRPQADRYISDSFLQTYSKPFDLSKDSLFNQFNIDFNTGVKTIRIADSGLVPGVVVNPADSLTSNGTWAAAGTASNLTVDNINYVSGGASLKFDATTGAAYLQNSTMNAQDLSAWKNQGHFFLWVYMPTASQFTNVKLQWGSSSTAYYEQTVTVNQEGNTFIDGWNLLDFPWLGATSSAGVVGNPNSGDWDPITHLATHTAGTYALTPYTSLFQTYIGNHIVGQDNLIPAAYLASILLMATYKGSTLSSADQGKLGNGSIQTPFVGETPTDTAINYLRVTCNVVNPQTAIRLDNIVFRLGTILEIVYYSKFLFRDAITGGWQETITDDSNIINLDTESYNLLVYQVGVHLAQQLQGLDAMFYDGNYFQQHYGDALNSYRLQNRSEWQKPTNIYYGMTRPGYSKYMTRRNW